jgi:CRISPR-associated protein Cas5d
MSYDVMTPSAARGIMESIYWHPGMAYRIDKIHVLNPIAFTSVRRNEVKSKALASSLKSAMVNRTELPCIVSTSDISQRASIMLRKVRYVIDCHFDLTQEAGERDNPAKFAEILKRRIKKGQCYSQPYLGTRECSCYFKPWEGDDPIGAYTGLEERDLGLMLYDLDYSDTKDIKPMFFRAVMRRGVIDVAGSEVYR